MSNRRASPLLPGGIRLKEKKRKKINKRIYIYIKFESNSKSLRLLESSKTKLAQSFACMKRAYGGKVFGNQDSNEKSSGRGKRIEVESILWPFVAGLPLSGNYERRRGKKGGRERGGGGGGAGAGTIKVTLHLTARHLP